LISLTGAFVPPILTVAEEYKSPVELTAHEATCPTIFLWLTRKQPSMKEKRGLLVLCLLAASIVIGLAEMTQPEVTRAIFQTTSYRTTSSIVTATETRTDTFYVLSTAFVTTSRLVTVTLTQSEMDGPYIRIEPEWGRVGEVPNVLPRMVLMELTLRVRNRMNVTITRGRIFVVGFDEPFIFKNLPPFYGWLGATQTQYVMVLEFVSAMVKAVLEKAEVEYETVKPNVEVPVATITSPTLAMITTTKTFVSYYALTDVHLTVAGYGVPIIMIAITAFVGLLFLAHRHKRDRHSTVAPARSI